MHACLFHVPVATSFDQIAVQVTALVALSTIRLGVYAVGTDGKPGALIADWGTVSSAAVATPTLGISWAPAAGTSSITGPGPRSSTIRTRSSARSRRSSASVTTERFRRWARRGSARAVPTPFSKSSSTSSCQVIKLSHSSVLEGWEELEKLP